MAKLFTAYQIEVEVGPDEWRRVGHRFGDRKAAQSWVSFVRAAWHGRKTRVAKLQLPVPAGHNDR